MATVNIPKLGNFGVAGYFVFDNLPDDTGASRWLPGAFDAQNYWATGPEKVTFNISNTVTKTVPFNPRTVKNPSGNCGFSFLPVGYSESNASAASESNGYFDYLYNSASLLSSNFNPDASSIANGGAPTMAIDSSHGTYGGLNNGFEVVNIIPLAQLPMSDTAPSPNDPQLQPGSENPVLNTDTGAVFDNGSTTGFTWDEPVGYYVSPPPPLPPFPQIFVPVVYPEPQSGIGACASRGASFEVKKKTWVPVTVNIIDLSTNDAPAQCTANPPGQDAVTIYFGDTTYPDGYVCNPDATIIVVQDASNARHAVAGRLIESVETVSFDVYLTGKFYTIDFAYKVTTGYFDNETQTVKTAILVDDAAPDITIDGYWNISHTTGNGSFVSILSAGGSGLAHKLTVQDNILVDNLFIAIPIFQPPNFYEQVTDYIGNTFGIYPMSAGLFNNGNSHNLPRRCLEAIDPTTAAGYDDVMQLVDATYLGSPDIGMIDGAWYVAPVMDGSGVPHAVFALRDGTGWYDCDLSEAMNNGQGGYDSVDYFGYMGGLMYVGSSQTSGPIKYRLIIPSVPRGRVPRVTLDLKAIGISFIPCQTHCLGQGGIISKV